MWSQNQSGANCTQLSSPSASLIGEAKEERQIMSGSFIKDKYEKPVSIRRKRQRPMDSPVIDQKRRQGDDRTTEQLNTSSNSFLQSNDKENSILDEILVPETQQQSQGGQVLGFVSVLLLKDISSQSYQKKSQL